MLTTHYNPIVNTHTDQLLPSAAIFRCFKLVFAQFYSNFLAMSLVFQLLQECTKISVELMQQK